MSRTKAIVGVCLIFFMGMVSGIAITMKFVEHRIQAMVNGGPEVLGEIIVRRLDHQLQLDARQRAELQKIVENARGQVTEIRTQTQPQVARVLAGSVMQIRAILTPDQATKFDTIVAKGRERWKGHFRAGGSGAAD